MALRADCVLVFHPIARCARRFALSVVVGMSDSSPSVAGLSRLRCLSTVIHVDEVSLFINDDSYVGREVARRIVARSTGFVRENPDDDASETDDVLSILLRRSCCVRFFAWLESTYVPSHLSLPFSSVWSSQLECQGTMKTMLEGSDLSAVCRDLFFMRQLVCEIFSIFFVPSRFGIVVERPSDGVNWSSARELVSSARYRRCLMDPRLMDFVCSCHFKSDSFGRRIISPGSSFLHFLCRHDHPSLRSVIMEYHKSNLSFGGTIYSQHRDKTYGSPAHQFRITHDFFAKRDHSEVFARSSPMFVLLRDLFQSGDEYNGSSLVGGDDYGQPL